MRFGNQKGIVQIPLLIGLLLVAAVLPLLSTYVSTHTTENRSRATTDDVRNQSNYGTSPPPCTINISCGADTPIGSYCYDSCGNKIPGRKPLLSPTPIPGYTCTGSNQCFGATCSQLGKQSSSGTCPVSQFCCGASIPLTATPTPRGLQSDGTPCNGVYSPCNCLSGVTHQVGSMTLCGPAPTNPSGCNGKPYATTECYSSLGFNYCNLSGQWESHPCTSGTSCLNGRCLAPTPLPTIKPSSSPLPTAIPSVPNFACTNTSDTCRAACLGDEQPSGGSCQYQGLLSIYDGVCCQPTSLQSQCQKLMGRPNDCSCDSSLQCSSNSCTGGKCVVVVVKSDLGSTQACANGINCNLNLLAYQANVSVEEAKWLSGQATATYGAGTPEGEQTPGEKLSAIYQTELMLLAPFAVPAPLLKVLSLGNAGYSTANAVSQCSQIINSPYATDEQKINCGVALGYAVTSYLPAARTLGAFKNISPSLLFGSGIVDVGLGGVNAYQQCKNGFNTNCATAAVSEVASIVGNGLEVGVYARQAASLKAQTAVVTVDPVAVESSNNHLFNLYPDKRWVVYHGGNEPLTVQSKYTAMDAQLAGKEGSLTLGMGLYTTPDKGLATNYATLRTGQQGGTANLAEISLNPKANVIDFTQGNENVPSSWVRGWRNYFATNFDPGQTTNVNTFARHKTTYIDYLDKIDPNTTTLRQLMGTDRRSPIPRPVANGSPIWADSFSAYMKSLSVDAAAVVEGGEDFFKSTRQTSLIIYNTDIIQSVTNGLAK